MYTFRVKDYINSESKIISQIQKRFSKRIIVRSSTSKEDGLSQSYAGEFLTVQNIDISSNKLISDTIDNVVNVYREKMTNYDNEEILVQEQSEYIVLSGVVFTKGLETNSPYYVITYYLDGI